VRPFTAFESLSLLFSSFVELSLEFVGVMRLLRVVPMAAAASGVMPTSAEALVIVEINDTARSCGHPGRDTGHRSSVYSLLVLVHHSYLCIVTQLFGSYTAEDRGLLRQNSRVRVILIPAAEAKVQYSQC
jgi:hypothetical protein